MLQKEADVSNHPEDNLIQDYRRLLRKHWKETDTQISLLISYQLCNKL